MATVYPQEIKDAAKFMWLRKCSVKEIAEKLNIPTPRVIYNWAEIGCWNEMLHHETVEQATARRLILLVERVDKTDADYKEIDRLSSLLDKLAGIDARKVKTVKDKALASSLGENGGEVKSKRRGSKSAIKNDITSITAEQLETIRKELFFDYQHLWHLNRHQRTRFILKSRQIGATFYFAWEAFEDAILSGDNQIFLSASKSQAEVFKAYILSFAMQYFDIELKGSNVISLTKDGKPWADLRFVSTNSRTAQGYHGHLYFDEVFWTPDFKKLNTLASAMASHAKWRKTYFSTPSVKTHGAYELWTGEKYNSRRKNKVEFNLNYEALAKGVLGADKIWRNVITVKDAEAGGCKLFDIKQLQDEYSQNEFDNLFMCKFIEAGLSVFTLSSLLACATDSSIAWVDFKAKERLPFGNNPVWVGYDPARVGDKSTVVVVAPPVREGGKFRVLEKHYLKGTFTHQANRIKEICDRYNVQFMGIDITGPGLGVIDEVKKFFKRATPIHYGVESKTRMVLKAIDVIECGRIEWDAEHKEIPQAFLQIHQITTGKDQISYAANRTSETGHSDVAWAIMHSLSNEPLTGRKKKATLSI